eukprot:5499766-Amphidinium_carterae.1
MRSWLEHYSSHCSRSDKDQPKGESEIKDQYDHSECDQNGNHKIKSSRKNSSQQHQNAAVATTATISDPNVTPSLTFAEAKKGVPVIDEVVSRDVSRGSGKASLQEAALFRAEN